MTSLQTALRLIAILTPTALEGAPLRRALQNRREERMAGLRITHGTYRQQEVVLAVCGIGKVHAARAAQMLCSVYRPAALIMTGGAGALSPDLQAGDLVVAEEVIQYDFGAWLSHGFRQAGRGATWQASTSWLERARLLARSQEREGAKSTTYFGTICSGDQIVAEAGRRETLAQVFQALAVDMESAAMAQVAAANDIPWLSVRGISDGVTENEALSLNLPLVIAPLTLWGTIEILGGFAGEMAGAPRRAGQLWAFLRRFRRAATVAAGFCLGLVSSP